jgi:hypothetical protein
MARHRKHFFRWTETVAISALGVGPTLALVEGITDAFVRDAEVHPPIHVVRLEFR